MIRARLAAVLAAVLAALWAGAVPSQPGSPQAITAPATAGSPQLRRGRLLYLQCRACHELRPDAPASVGPHLADLFGRKAAGAPGFGYSEALRAQSFVWDRERLDRWLASPGTMVPGNTMAYAGLADAADRAALIAYLESATVTR